MARIRNLVIGCDGTWNEPEKLADGQPAPTNVEKFLDALASRGGQQVKHYEKGVGTRPWEALPGGIYGYGLEKRILGCYRFLRKRFADSGWKREENKVFLIGFSRGAYTVRRLSGLIAHSGLPVKSKDSELGWELYKERDKKSAEELKRQGRFFDISVEMIGIWDTVKATNDADYHAHELCANVAAGYHAMAIDERRKFFPILKWNSNPKVLQVWFAGVHSDVGGGYLEAGLSDIALRWMIDRALSHRLQFKANYVGQNVKPNPSIAGHDSYEGIWLPLGVSQRQISATDLVHHSVGTRLHLVPSYRPINLPVNPVYC